MKKLILLVAVIFLASCSDESLDVVITPVDKVKDPNSDFNELRNAYFGDTHVHTKHSFDAYLFGTTGSPADAYRYARGETVKHPAGFDMKLVEPLDFYMVSDHGFFMGMMEAYADTSTDISNAPGAEVFHNMNAPENLTLENGATRLNTFASTIANFFLNPRSYFDPELWRAVLTQNLARGLEIYDHEVHLSAWADVVKAANDAYDPGNFTTFIGYEFTTSTDVANENLHRNVMFKSSNAPKRPYTRIDSINPEDLWNWMDKLREQGVDSIAFPHNSNGSNGQMFEMETFHGEPLSKEYAALRMRNEPIVEMTQVKGTSDTHPLLSPNDEWADFEIMEARIGSIPPAFSFPAGGYVRDAYIRGLMSNQFGTGNPYKFGLIGASDTHVLGGGFREDNYWSKIGLVDADPRARGSVPVAEEDRNLVPNRGGVSFAEYEQGDYVIGGLENWGASGLAGAWAEENTRESIFNAFRRKETFATSGPRILVRFFGGYDLDELTFENENIIKDAYESGVPMGGDIFEEETDKAPSFLIWAQRDVNGAPLQRIQVIKGSISRADSRPTEKVYDVACSDGLEVDPQTNRCPDNGARVDIETCAISKNVGAAELKTIWTDPDFDKTDSAFYYVRVLENPTCRWSTWDAIRAGFKPREDLHDTIQDRAWSSPIWYTPNNAENPTPIRLNSERL